MSFVYPKTSPAPAPEGIQKLWVLNCVFLHISPRTWSSLDLWFLCWFLLWVVAVGRWYGTLVWLAVFRLFHVEHVIMFVPWQHEIHGICNGKHKTDADFGPSGIKSFLIKQTVVPVPSLPTKQGWEDYNVVLLRHVPTYKSGWMCLVWPVWFFMYDECFCLQARNIYWLHFWEIH